METNPYVAPASYDPLSLPTAGAIRIDGQQVVVRSGVTLPPFCIKTGEPVSAGEMEKKTLTWSPAYVVILIVLSFLIGLIVYFFVRKQCTVNFGLSAAVRRKNRTRRLLAAGLTVLFCFGIFLGNAVDNTGTLLVLSLVMSLVCLMVTLLGFAPLSAAKHQNGDFWLNGCSPQFIAKLAEQVPRS